MTELTYVTKNNQFACTDIYYARTITENTVHSCYANSGTAFMYIKCTQQNGDFFER